MACEAWKAEQRERESMGPFQRRSEMLPEQLALQKKITETGTVGLSFFTWFGFVGRRTHARHATAGNVKTESEERRRGKVPWDVLPHFCSAGGRRQDEEGLEIFTGGDLALAIAEDLWPGTIQYFSE